MSTVQAEPLTLRRVFAIAWRNQSARSLLLVHAVDCVGNGIYFATFALYLNRYLHFSPATVGFILGVAGVVGLFSSLIVGVWADRVGPKRVLMLVLALLGLSFVALPLGRSVVWVGLFCVISSVLHISCPGPFVALIGQSFEPRYRQAGRSLIRSVGNISMALGAGLAAIGLSLYSDRLLQWSPMANGLTFLLAAALLRLVTVGTEGAPTPGGPKADRRYALRQRGMLQFVLATSVMGLHSTILSIAVPLWIAYSHVMPAWSVPVLIGVNTLLVFQFQVRASERAGASFASAVRWSRIAAGSIAVGGLLILLGGRGPVAWLPIAVAFILFTLAELWQNGSFFHFSFAIATDAQRSEYASALNVAQVLESMVGPLVIGVAMGPMDVGVWPLVSVIMVVSACFYGLSARRVAYLFPEEAT